MGLLKNLRDRRNQQTRVERNTETLRREFRRELTKEDLSDMIRLMDEPEVHKPLFKNAEAFGRQPEMDDILRARFQLKALDILGRDSEELESVLSAFNEGSDTYETDQDTRRLSDKLLFAGQDEHESVKDRIANRIRATRQDINDRIDYQQEKVRNKFRSIDRSIERRVRPLVDVAQDSVKGMLQGVKDRVQSFKDDYRTRQITIENAQNWEIALEKGVSAEQIESVIEHADYPEVRYGVMKHASALFEQDAMTPELATDLFHAYQPHTNAQNEVHENFYNQLETYANTVVEQAETNELSVSPDEYAQQVEARKPVSPEEYAQSVEARNKTVSPEEYAQSVEARNKTVSPDEYAQQVETPKDTAVEQSSTAEQPRGRMRVQSGRERRQRYQQVRQFQEEMDEILANKLVEYRKEYEQFGAPKDVSKKSAREIIENAPLDSEASKDFWMSEYGDESAMAFENSYTQLKLMARNGIDTLPDLPQTDEGLDLDVRQAQLLWTSVEGDDIWGVPYNGEIIHLSDEDLEVVFMEQYGKAIDTHDIHTHDIPDTHDIHTHNIPSQLEGDVSKDYWLSNYGDDDVVALENSRTLARLMSRNGIDTLPDLPQTDEGFDVRQAQLLGISRQGDAVWGVPDNGEIRHLSDDELEGAFMRQYGKAIDTHDIPSQLEGDSSKEYWLSNYGDRDVVEFKDSSTLSQLMSHYGIVTLPDLPLTDEGLDVRQAQLLGISNEGDAVWGVPDNGEIRHLSDDEVEAAFTEQYVKALNTPDISSPDQSDAPAEDESYDFYESLAREFNQQWDEESELMASSAPLPAEHDLPPLPDVNDLPPLPDEDDIPPLSFEGLEEEQQQQM